jgi:cyclophilin family peptidyl-prolyl cis-trans isomerase
MRAHRAWSPLGVDRFHYLARNGFYDGAWFFRVVGGFVAQWGLPGAPPLDSVWQTRIIPDEPVKVSNTRGRIAYARGGPNTRSIQLFVSTADNVRLDTVSTFGLGPGQTACVQQYASYQARVDGTGTAAGAKFKVLKNGAVIANTPSRANQYAAEFRSAHGNFPGPVLLNADGQLRCHHLARFAPWADFATGDRGGDIISLIAGVAAFICLVALGVPSPVVLALWVAFADLIPLVGATLGAAVCVIAAACRCAASAPTPMRVRARVRPSRSPARRSNFRIESRGRRPCTPLVAQV